jgi:hypothetical protein
VNWQVLKTILNEQSEKYHTVGDGKRGRMGGVVKEVRILALSRSLFSLSRSRSPSQHGTKLFSVQGHGSVHELILLALFYADSHEWERSLSTFRDALDRFRATIENGDSSASEDFKIFFRKIGQNLFSFLIEKLLATSVALSFSLLLSLSLLHSPSSFSFENLDSL